MTLDEGAQDRNKGARPPSSFPDKTIILDTNALLSPFQFAFNLDQELKRAAMGYHPAVPMCVIRELDRLIKGGDWKGKAARKLADNYDHVEVKGTGDGPIFNLAVNKEWAVMTFDKRLRSKLLSRGIPVLTMKGKDYLSFIVP
ncbi:MAG: hypothetical protein KAH57_03025 [Thermoplasmata archaeon]|nr:hypothetical protein [Thermoplasmata archaeon]